MKVYLDDTRPAPDGWVLCRWPNEVIELLATGEVTDLSLDHDLGDDVRGTGYDVLTWLEARVVNGFTPPEYIVVHSANVAARQRMQQAIMFIQRWAKSTRRL